LNDYKNAEKKAEGAKNKNHKGPGAPTGNYVEKFYEGVFHSYRKSVNALAF
jgi:hypothetical protein